MPGTWKRTSTKGKWTEESLKEAFKYIDGGNSISAASRVYNIPFSTLQERRKKQNFLKPVLGCNPTFSADQESALADRIKKLSDLFYGITAIQVRKVAYEFAEKNNIPHKFSQSEKIAGRDWFNGFLNRNPSLSMRKPKETSMNRITGFNRIDVERFYSNLEEILKRDIFTPDRIYNADETGITTVTEPGTIEATKGKKRVGSVTSWERGKLVTVLCCMNAAGNYIPPMFIFPRKQMSPLLMKNGPPCAKYECSPKGWINEELFVAWLKHFIYHSKASKENIVLLILDNHSSHATLQSYEVCREHGVIMLSLPPHCSHRMQPLDVTFYSTLKAAFKRECDLYIKTRHLTRITPYDLAELFNKAYSKVATIAVAVNGFKATGIEPFDANIFTDNDFLAADKLHPQTNISLPTMDNDELGQCSEDTTQKVQAGPSTSSNLNIEQQEESGSADFTPDHS